LQKQQLLQIQGHHKIMNICSAEARSMQDQRHDGRDPQYKVILSTPLPVNIICQSLTITHLIAGIESLNKPPTQLQAKRFICNTPLMGRASALIIATIISG
jgi:hypothetical protein